VTIEKRIKYQTLAVVILIITLFGLFFIYEVNKYVDEKLQDTLSYKKSFEVKLFNHTLHHHSGMYTRRIDRLLSDKTILEAFASKNRELLLNKTIGAFKQFQKENSYIKIFTFRLPDGTAFLRVHKPEMFGDALNKKRKIIIDTNIDKSRKYGFEIGKLKMTYRIVTPIFKDNKYLGLVELGVEPEGFMKIVNHIIPLNYALVVKEDMRDIMLNKPNISSKNGYVLAKSNKLFQNILDKIAINERKFITIEGKKLAIDANMVLKDHNGTIEAFFLTIGDITDDINKAAYLKKSFS